VHSTSGAGGSQGGAGARAHPLQAFWQPQCPPQPQLPADLEDVSVC
jgi:hypothetical protein